LHTHVGGGGPKLRRELFLLTKTGSRPKKKQLPNPDKSVSNNKTEQGGFYEEGS
jgi:hypothetical protein